MRATVATTLVLAALVGGVARAQRMESTLGSQVRLDVRGPESLSGELLAARGDSLWLLVPHGGMRSVALTEVTRARVPRGGPTSRRILTWTVIGGVVSGALLAGACNSTEDADCGVVLPAVLLSWGVVGGGLLLLNGSDWRTVTADVPALAPYARFPQGMPPGFVPAASSR